MPKYKKPFTETTYFTFVCVMKTYSELNGQMLMSVAVTADLAIGNNRYRILLILLASSVRSL